MQTFRAMVLVLLGCSLWACSESVLPATQVVVAIDGDSQVAASIRRIKAEIFVPTAQDGAMPSDSRLFELVAPGRMAGAGQLTLPLTFGVLKGDHASFLLVVQGFDDDSEKPVIEYKALASFRKQQTRLLSVRLTAACYGRASACGALDATCDPASASGSCAPVHEAPTREVQPGGELDGWDNSSIDSGADAELDGGAATVVDAASDAAPRADGAMTSVDAASDGAALDGSLANLDAASDGALDAGNPADATTEQDTATPLADAGITLGAPCRTQGAFACVGSAQRKRLTCAGTWQAAADCAESSNCDTRDGSCKPVVAECVGKSPNESVCVDAAAHVCGPDLVNVTLMPVSAGVCGALCMPEATQCSGAIPQTCNTSGQWDSGSVTVGKCNAVCVPSSPGCNGTTPRTCLANGQWREDPVVLGQCGAVCKPNALRCDLINLVGQQCKADGTWGTNGSSVSCNCTEANRYNRVDQNLVIDTKTNLTWDFYVQPATTWDAAISACAARGMRLPSLGEWAALTPANTSFDFCKPNAVPVDLAGLPTTSSDFPFWVNSMFAACCGNVMRFFASTTNAPGSISSTDRDKTQPMSYRCVK